MKPGDIIQFGKYLQYYKDPTPIEWIVLEINGNTATLITRNGVEIEPYHKAWCPVSWETCSLREWLNDEFLRRTFSADEQARMVEVTVPAHKNPHFLSDPGNDTRDKVFLLSAEEAKKYFKTDEERQCIPTRLAVLAGAWLSRAGTCVWWLRTPGESDMDAVKVGIDGSVQLFGDRVNIKLSVRPAIVVRFDPSSMN